MKKGGGDWEVTAARKGPCLCVCCCCLLIIPPRLLTSSKPTTHFWVLRLLSSCHPVHNIPLIHTNDESIDRLLGARQRSWNLDFASAVCALLGAVPLFSCTLSEHLAGAALDPAFPTGAFASSSAIHANQLQFPLSATQTSSIARHGSPAKHLAASRQQHGRARPAPRTRRSQLLQKHSWTWKSVSM